MVGTAIKNREAELNTFRSRALFCGACVLLAFMVLAGRMIYLQVIKREYYHTLAEANRISVVPVVPNRGLILDRNGEVLAANYSAYTLEVMPARVPNMEKALDDLATIVDIQPRDRRRFKRLMEESKNFESLPIRNRLSEEEVARFAVNRYRFPGFDIQARLFRNYPHGDVASHAIGYIGRINDAEVKKIEAAGLASKYKGTEHIGKLGVEGSYEAELHGITGSKQVEIDAAGRAIRSLSTSAPRAGNNLTLTLDIKLQRVVEDVFGDRRGAFVALDPRNGEILALVSKPGFDPGLFIDGIDPQNWDLLNTSIDKPLLNRALRGAYPPGSTLKPFLALAALESGKRTPSQGISDAGFFALPGVAHRWNDDKKGGHGWVDMYKSIVESCDTYYYQLAAETDIDKTADFLRLIGFGAKTGIDIDGEVEGILPSKAWKEKRFARAAADARKWYLGDSISAGIGQGYNAFTPMQLAHGVAALANQGIAYRPRLLKAVTDSGSGARRDMDAVIDGKLGVNPQNLEVIRRSLEGVVKEGTSARVFTNAGYISAGKTGTAQVFGLKGEKYVESRVAERLRDHAWYIAYAPAENPTIALAVLVENGGFGATAAAPIARAAFDYHLLGKQPDPKLIQAFRKNAEEPD
ncbi:MAG: penicillin-binding protein 2 [Betaproteobacteria bacterium]|nr:penicillin-binding protein 2 [Betaproteobacteria bacterium]